MLFYLASWILLAMSGAVIGSAILAITKSSVFSHFGDRMITTTWLGLLTIGTTLLGLSVILPLSPTISFGLLAILTAVAVSTNAVRRDLRIPLQYLTSSVVLSLGILAVIAALNSTRLVEAYDTGLYYYQLIRWLSQYGTVPGLALIFRTLGYSSSWFALAAPFDFGPFQGRVAGLVGGLAILLCLLHFALAVSRIVQHRADRADWFLAGGYTLIFLVCFSWAFEVSLSPDLPVWILTLLIGWLMLFAGRPGLARDSGLRSGHSPILPLILALGATSIKRSAAPTVVIAGLFYWFNSTAKWNIRLVYGSIAALFALPMLVANVASSGCPLYPNSLLCLDVSWGVGKAGAQLVTADVASWARWGGSAPSGATAWNWMLPWISHLDKLLLISFCGVCLLGFVAARGWRAGKSSLYVLGLSLVGTAFVFVTAPNPRFGAGYLALYPALFLAAVGPHLAGSVRWRLVDPDRLKRSTTLAHLLLGLAVLVAAQGSVRELRLRRKIEGLKNLETPTDSKFLSRLLLPPAVGKSPGDLVVIKNRRFDRLIALELTTERSNGIEYRRPLNTDQCWAAALPCVPTSLEGDVRLRYPDNGFRSGFTRSANFP